MDELKFADVAVDSPVGHARVFTYSIPAHLTVHPGHLVWVPFGSQTLQGIVVELSSADPGIPTRDILQSVEPGPLLDSRHLQWGWWLSRHYRSPLFAALSLMLPPGFETRVRSRIFPGAAPAAGRSALREETIAAIEEMEEKGRMEQPAFVKLLGRRGTHELNRLLQSGAVQREVTIPRPGVAPKYEAYLVPSSPPEGEGHEESLSPKQTALLEAVRLPPRHLPLAEANREFGAAAVRALWQKELVATDWWRVSGGPPPIPDSRPGQFTLTAEQQRALAEITGALDASFGERPRPNPSPAGAGTTLAARSFLLHGVTGSGKTEVYLRAIDHTIRLDRRALFLVPEIALTPQTLERVNAWFAGRVAILHSRQTPRQKFDQWWDIRGGSFDVVVGPRSALFAPVEDLGLIVIDEEHEWTYKQEETAPLYHARAAALELARLAGAAVVLGSATPSVESYYHASRNRLRLLELPRRVAGRAVSGATFPPHPNPLPQGEGTIGGNLLPQGEGTVGGNSLPQGEGTIGGNSLSLAQGHREEMIGGAGPMPSLARVEVCDMRQELRRGNRHIFSRALSDGLQQCLDDNHQAILFLNRRGTSSIVQCRDCGYVAVCRRCHTSLTYHAGPPRLLCHQCNLSRRPLTRCPDCRGERIRQLGIGTERVVNEVAAMFPGATVDRLDSDSARSAGAAEEAVGRLASGETQVLVGTQMVAKGLDIPNVALVGVVLADIGLHLPDFRAGERAFALLCQVAGRAGRGEAPGKVFVQTYNPDHYAIHAGASQDYRAMYDQEIESRRRLGYPPFNQLAHIVYQNTDLEACQQQATAIADELKRRAAAGGRTDIEVSGPAPGLPPRLLGRHRWRLLLRGRGLPEFLDDVDFPTGCTIDIDPAHVT